MFYILARLSVDVMYSLLFFFNDTATTEIYTLSLHDALPIYRIDPHRRDRGGGAAADAAGLEAAQSRSEGRTGRIDVAHEHAALSRGASEHGRVDRCREQLGREAERHRLGGTRTRASLGQGKLR